VIAV